MACDPIPVFVDCDGNALTSESDELGNAILKFCSSTQLQVTAWDGVTTPVTCTPGFYRDTNSGEITAWCDGTQLIPFCCGGGSTETTIEACYNVSLLAAGEFCLGGGDTGWQVNGTNQLPVTCQTTTETTETVSPDEVQAQPNYNTFDGTPAPQGQLAGLYSTATATGQTSTVTVNSDSGGPNYFGSERPTMFVDFPSNAAGEGPLKVRFLTTATSGAISVVLWHRTTDTFADITGATAQVGTVLSYNNIPGYGDWLFMDTRNGVAGIHEIEYDLTDGIGADEFTLVLFAMGGNAPNSTEEISNIEFTYTLAGTGVGECCECYTAAQLAALMTGNDPNGNTWTLSDGRICSNIPQSQFSSYGDLETCEGSIAVNDEAVTLDDSFTGTVGTQFIESVAANDTGNFTNFVVTGGTVPPGLSLSATGALLGTPTTPGSYTFTYLATTAAGAGDSATVAVSIVSATPVFTSVPTGGCFDTTTEFCAECDNGTVTFQQLINGVWTDV